MQALLLKDYYQTKKYCRSYFLIVVLFLALSAIGNTNYFLLFYPCLICGMIPANLLGLDERSKWSTYCRTLPYTKAQLVSAKYLSGLIPQCVILILTAVIQSCKMAFTGELHPGELGALIAMLICGSCVSAALSLPFMFRYGVEKGRVAYLVTVGIICGGSVVAQTTLGAETTSVSSNAAIYITALVAVALYALSWYLSIVFYNRREL